MRCFQTNVVVDVVVLVIFAVAFAGCTGWVCFSVRGSCLHAAGCPASVFHSLVFVSFKLRAMSAEVFQERLDVLGELHIGNVSAVLETLQLADLVVTKEQLEQGLASLGHDGEHHLTASDLGSFRVKI